ncbi:MAG: DUF1592 domain-containing protein [Myxococcota bacterium]
MRTLPFLAVWVAGCTGAIGDGSAAPPSAVDRPTRPPPTTPQLTPELHHREPSFVRRLSNQELQNAARDLAGLERSTALARVPDKRDAVYERVAESQTISPAHLEAFVGFADEIADALLGEALTAQVPFCEARNRSCTEAFIDDVGPKALRRPLTSRERTAWLSIFDLGETFDEGFRLVVHAMFRSPNFLYLVEIGAEDGRLTDHELAARLSFAICETVPDEALRAAANAGELRVPESLAMHAARLLAAPCARTTLDRFFAQWLRLDEVPSLERDRERFPDFTSEHAAAMHRESTAFLSHVLWESSGELKEIFSADYSILDATTAELYGLSEADGRTTLPGHRRGILTHPSILALTSRPTETAPIQRGLFVIDRLLCGELPHPPEDLEIVPPEFDDSMTTRERWERHSSDPACSGCHRLLDPVGFAMEDFDAVGRFRTTEHELPVDATGGIPLLGIPAGEIVGGAELAEALATSPELAFCASRHLLRFVLARLESSVDQASVEATYEVLRAGGSIQDGLLRLFSTQSFRYRKGSPE